MEVDIQAEFSEGQALPNQAAMGPLVAQIMRAVTGQAAPPARQPQQASRALPLSCHKCSAFWLVWGVINSSFSGKILPCTVTLSG